MRKKLSLSFVATGATRCCQRGEDGLFFKPRDERTNERTNGWPTMKSSAIFSGSGSSPGWTSTGLYLSYLEAGTNAEADEAITAMAAARTNANLDMVLNDEGEIGVLFEAMVRITR